MHRGAHTFAGILTGTGRKWLVPDTSVPTKTGQCTAAMETVSRVACIQHKSVGKMTIILDLVAIIWDPRLLTLD